MVQPGVSANGAMPPTSTDVQKEAAANDIGGLNREEHRVWTRTDDQSILPFVEVTSWPS